MKFTSANGKLTGIIFDGPRSHLNVKKFAAACSSISGRGSVLVRIDDDIIQVSVWNEGTQGEPHSAIEER